MEKPSGAQSGPHRQRRPDRPRTAECARVGPPEPLGFQQLDVSQHGSSTWKMLPPPGAGSKPDLAAEPVHDLLDDAQAETGAALLPGVGRVDLDEFLEDARLAIFLRDAGAVIAHGDPHRRALLSMPTMTSPPAGENFTALDRRLVTTWVIRSGSTRTSPRREAGSSRTVTPKLSAKPRLASIACSASACSSIGLKSNTTLPDSIFSMSRMSLISRTSRWLLFWAISSSRRRLRQRAGGAAGEQAERAGDRGQRRAQFVADGGDEFVLQALDALAVADVDDDAEHKQAISWYGSD